LPSGSGIEIQTEVKEMNNPPLISVVMPVYNGGQFLGKAIDSIQRQTFTNFEFIIIDDGSSDDSRAIIQAYQQKDPRIHPIFLEQNSGIVTALNTGLNAAAGKYIARMDADDISLPTRFEEQINYLEDHPDVDVISSYYQLIGPTGDKLGNIIKLPTTNLTILWSLCIDNPIVHPGVVIRTEAVRNIGGYRAIYPHAEDYDLWMRLSDKSHFANLAHPLIQLRRHSSNITVVHHDDSMESSISISQMMLQKVLSQKIEEYSVQPFWMNNSSSSSNVKQAVNILVNLSQHFLSHFLLSEGERAFIKKDALLRILRLVKSNKFSVINISIIAMALRIDIRLFMKMIFSWIIYRDSTKLLQNQELSSNSN
jgi:glycosyltransferase involved in cell wall biosynthesis